MGTPKRHPDSFIPKGHSVTHGLTGGSASSLLRLGINRFRTDTRQHTQLPGKSADNIIRRVHGNTDNGNILFPIWNAHSAHNVLSIFTEQMVQLLHRISTVQNDSNQSNSRLHKTSLYLQNIDKCKKIPAPKAQAIKRGSLPPLGNEKNPVSIISVRLLTQV